jgi:gas vesicle protein
MIALKVWSQDCTVKAVRTNMEKLEMSCNRSSSALFFLAGLGAGIALAVLLAPRSGGATRRIIGSEVEEGKDWVKGKAAAAQSYVKTHAEQLGERSKEVAESFERT